MTATTRGSPVGGNDNQGQAPDGQSQPPLQQNQVRHYKDTLEYLPCAECGNMIEMIVKQP